ASARQEPRDGQGRDQPDLATDSPDRRGPARAAAVRRKMMPAWMDGAGVASGAIQGGKLDGLELTLNWYLNTNLKIQFEYLHNNRYDLRAGQVPGNLDAFGIRTQLFGCGLSTAPRQAAFLA